MLLSGGLLVSLLLAASVAVAQRPTAEVARPAAGFWPLDTGSGTVTFSGPTATPNAPALAQAEHARAWLTATCGPAWEETVARAIPGQFYWGQLAGVHPGVQLKFALQVVERAQGWQYRLLLFEISSPTGDPTNVHWLPLHRVLNDPDFRPDVRRFQQQLQRALPGL